MIFDVPRNFVGLLFNTVPVKKYFCTVAIVTDHLALASSTCFSTQETILNDVYLEYEFIEKVPRKKTKINRKVLGKDARSSSSDRGDLDFHLVFLHVSTYLQIIYPF